MIEASLIIPLYNEEKNITKLFKMIFSQKILPKEIIFIDAGSIDETNALVKNNIDAYQNNEINIILLNKKKILFPGASRNEGIINSKYNILLFMDAGIDFDENWINSLFILQKKTNKKIIWGSCNFRSYNCFTEALSSITYGKNNNFKTLPGSLIYKEIFNTTGLFNANLGSAEDILFMNNVKDISSIINNESILKYNTFPNNIISVFSKWFRNAFFSIKSKQYYFQSIIYIIFFMTLFFNFIFFIKLFFLQINLYFLTRTFLLPIIKNKNIFWTKNLNTFMHSLYLPLIIDFAKFFGFIKGYVKK